MTLEFGKDYNAILGFRDFGFSSMKFRIWAQAESNSIFQYQFIVIEIFMLRVVYIMQHKNVTNYGPFINCT